MHGIVGQAWTFTCNNNYKHNTLYVLSVQATVQQHEQVNGILEICTGMS